MTSKIGWFDHLGGGDAPGRHRRPRLVLQIGAFDVEQFPQEAEVDRRAVERDVLGREFEFAHEQTEQIVAHVVGHLEPHGPLEPAAAQFHLDRFEQVVGLLLLEREVGVAADPERRPFLDDHPDEQTVEPSGDELFDRQEPVGSDAHEPREHVRHLQPGEPTIARFPGRRR